MIGLVILGMSYTLLGQGPGAVSDVNELFEILSSHDVPALERFSRRRADLNATNANGATPLKRAIVGSAHRPTVYGQVKVLLRAGADPSYSDKNKQTPLHYAAIYGGSAATARVLIEAGSNVDATDRKGMSALQLAAVMGNIGVRSALEASTVTPA